MKCKTITIKDECSIEFKNRNARRYEKQTVFKQNLLNSLKLFAINGDELIFEKDKFGRIKKIELLGNPAKPCQRS